MIGSEFKPMLEVPVKTIPWDKSGNYFNRIIRWLLYTRQWQFSEDWYFKLFDKTWIKIPRGFMLDGASIPKPFRFLLQPTGILFIPGIIHDYGYKYDKLVGVVVKELAGGFLKVMSEFDYCPNAGKAWWDHVFKKTGYQISRFYVIPNITYLALIFGGWFAWNRQRRQQKQE